MPTLIQDAAGEGPDLCPNCGAPRTGAYCQDCGQKRASPDDLTIRHFAREVVQEATDVDSKVLATVKALLFRPGFLTKEYLAGRKARYLSPVKLFLIVSALYFLFAWDASLQILDFERKLREDSSLQSMPLPRNVDRDAFLEEWFEKAGVYSAYFRFLSVAGFGLALAVLYRRKRRPFGEHLIFASHYYAFDFLFHFVLILALIAVQTATGWKAPPWTMYSGLPVLPLYTFIALRRVHEEPAGTAAVKALVLLACDLGLTGAGSLLALALSAFSVLSHLKP